jgi:hypothetical protein
VTVHVDQPGHHVVAAQIDLASTGRELRALRIFLGATGRADRHHLHDCDCLR